MPILMGSWRRCRPCASESGADKEIASANKITSVACAINLDQRAEAVVFELEEPIRIVEGVGAALQHERRQLWERIGHGCG